jgi:hypothetical protein
MWKLLVQLLTDDVIHTFYIYKRGGGKQVDNNNDVMMMLFHSEQSVDTVNGA